MIVGFDEFYGRIDSTAGEDQAEEGQLSVGAVLPPLIKRALLVITRLTLITLRLLVRSVVLRRKRFPFIKI